MTRTRYRIFETEHSYFMTSAIVAWLPVFNQPRFVEQIFDSWRFLQREREVTIFAYVILENHLHWIASAPQLGKHVGYFKSFTARQMLAEINGMGYHTLLQEFQFYKARHKQDQHHQPWQEGSRPEQIQNVEMMWQKIEYPHGNPVKRRYVDDLVHWRYSSARNCAGQAGLLEVCTDWQ